MPVDCLVIGAGPAGLTAGIYLRRFYREVCVIDAGCSRANLIPLSHNYPGFPDGISGKDLLGRLRAQLVRHGGEVITDTVDALYKSAGNEFSASTGKKTYRAKTVLLATGVVDNEPALAGFQSLKDQGLIRFCPICDGFEFTELRIGVIGAGEHGVREIEFIGNYSSDLSFIGVGTNAGLGEKLVQRLKNDKVKLIMGKCRRLHADKEGPGPIRLEMADETMHYFDVLYCALGVRARSELAVKLGAEHDDLNGLLVNEHLQTSIPGLYAAGDVVSCLDQLAVATGQAAIASTAIHNHLLQEKR